MHKSLRSETALATKINKQLYTIDIIALALQGRRYNVVYNSSSLSGQITVAVLTQCCVPPHLQFLGSEHLLGPFEAMEVALFRSYASQGSSAVDSLYDLLIRILRVRKVEN